jgi:hypothetical protein
MRKSTPRIVATSVAAIFLGGVSLAASQLPPAPQPVVYCSPFSDDGISILCPTPLAWQKAPLSTPLVEMVKAGVEMVKAAEQHGGIGSDYAAHQVRTVKPLADMIDQAERAVECAGTFGTDNFASVCPSPRAQDTDLERKLFDNRDKS